jgi:hypothetical protein
MPQCSLICNIEHIDLSFIYRKWALDRFLFTSARNPTSHRPPLPAPCHDSIDLSRGQLLVPHLLLNHGHRHSGHQRIYHMAVPEDVRSHLPAGEFLPGRNLLDHSLLCQAVYSPKHGLGAQMPVALAGEQPHLGPAAGSPRWPGSPWRPGSGGSWSCCSRSG